MRDESVIKLSDMYYLEQLIIANGGGIIIHCTDGVTVLWERCTSRGEDYITDYETFTEIYRGYKTLLNNTAHLIPVVRYVAGN